MQTLNVSLHIYIPNLATWIVPAPSTGNINIYIYWFFLHECLIWMVTRIVRGSLTDVWCMVTPLVGVVTSRKSTAMLLKADLKLSNEWLWNLIRLHLQWDQRLVDHFDFCFQNHHLNCPAYEYTKSLAGQLHDTQKEIHKISVTVMFSSAQNRWRIISITHRDRNHSNK